MLPFRGREDLGAMGIPHGSSITGTLPSDCLVSYQDTHWGVGSYPSAEVQSVYSKAPANWATFLEFKVAKLIVQFFYKLKKGNYIVYIMSSITKLNQFLEQTHEHVHTKIQQVCCENKLI